MRSMLGVLKPIIPRLSALTLNWPMSSPQMTRMLGIWPAASCFCSTAALGLASSAGAAARARGLPPVRGWSQQAALPPADSGPCPTGVVPASSAILKAVTETSARASHNPRAHAGCPADQRLPGNPFQHGFLPNARHKIISRAAGDRGALVNATKPVSGSVQRTQCRGLPGGLSGTGCPEADQTLAADRLPGVRQCTKRSPSDRPSHLAGPSSGGTNAPTTPCATGRLATAFSEARYKPGRNPGSPSRNYNSSRGTSPPGTRCCGRPDRASTRVSSTRNPSVWYTMAQKSSTLTGRDVGYSAFALVLPITWPWR